MISSRDLSRLSFEEKRALLKETLKNRGARPTAGRVTGSQGGFTGIPEAYYRFELFPEVQTLQQRKEDLAARKVPNPFFQTHEGVANNRTTVGCREYINYSSYNYLGFSGEKEINEAVKEAVDRYGTSTSASRIASGERPIHLELERELADLLGVEDCVVFVSGHATNVTTIGHLFGPKDLILHDALSHNSIMQGALLSRARRIPFPHNDSSALDRLLEQHRRDHERVLVVIEGVYSMDGDIANLPWFIEAKKRHKAFLMIDEAHSMGVLGQRGFGIGEHFNIVRTDVDLWMGTLSKTFASCGGYIAGSKAIVEYLKYAAPGFLYSVGMSPTNAAAALAAVRMLKKSPERVARLHERAQLFLSLSRAHGFNTGLSTGTPVIPLILGNSLHCLRLSISLKERGINVQPVLYPAVAEDAARLRFFLSSCHTEEQIRETVDAISECIESIIARFPDETVMSG